MSESDLYLVQFVILGRFKLAFIDPITHLRYCPLISYLFDAMAYTTEGRKGTVIQVMLLGFAIAVDTRNKEPLIIGEDGTGEKN